MLPLRNFRRFFFKALKQPGYALKIFFYRYLANFSYFLTDGYAGFPESITLFLTHRCNLRCKMCGQWGEAGVSRKEGQEALKQELALEDYRKLLDRISCAWPCSTTRPSITLFGGEPLLHPACLDIIRYIKSKEMHCLMITNGSLLSGIAGPLVESGLDELNISLDGGRDLHDQIRGMEGLFEKIMDGIAAVNMRKAELKRTKPLINLQCTITRYNYQSLEQMIPVAEKTRANSLTFHNLIFLDCRALEEQKAIDQELGSSSKEWQGFVFDPGIDPEVLAEKRKQILAKKLAFTVDFYPDFSEKELTGYYRDPSYRPPRNSRCLSPWLVGYVFPDGEVRPCLNNSYSFGNIREKDFSLIWNSDQARKFRQVLRRERVFPACVRCTELYRY